MSAELVGKEGLPKGWEETTLGAVVDYGQTDKTEPEEIPLNAWVLELEDIEKDSSKILSRETFGKRESKSTKNKFSVGDVLYGKLRPYLNKVIIADDEGYCTTEIIPIKSGMNLDPRFIFYWLKHPDFSEYVNTVSHGMNMPRLGTEAGREAPFILAPLAEQIRIADKLDALLSRVEAGRERLERVPKLLKRFRQSVLSAAVSGELTREWRGGGDAEWSQTKFDQIGAIGRGKSKHRPRNDPALYGREYPFIQTGDVARSKEYITHNTSYYSEFGLSQSKLWPSGTICITIAANIGDTAILTYPACFPDSVVGIEVDRKIALPQYIKWSIDHIKSDLESFAPATAQKNINLDILEAVRFPLPPLPEQAEIVRRVEALFAIADRLEARCKAASAHYQRLTPALLAKAFRGELVEQDPNDEPASVLLERIRAQRAVAGTPAIAGGRGRRPKVPTPEAEAGGEQAEPKRRGRPRKVSAEAGQSSRGIPVAASAEEAIRLLQERARAEREGKQAVQAGLFGGE